MVNLLFPSVVEAPCGIHQQLYPAVSQNVGTNWRVVVATTGADVVFRRCKQFGHSLRSEISWHHEVSDFVTAEIGGLAWTIALMPVCGNQNPAALADLRKKRFVCRARVGSYVLLVDAVPNAASMKFLDDLGAVPVFVKIEGEVRQPSL
jgi:hypothetical protein